MKDHTWNSIEEEEAAYLLLPYTEESYQAISAILDKRLKEFLEAELEDDPELRVARAADGKPPIIPDWDGPLSVSYTHLGLLVKFIPHPPRCFRPRPRAGRRPHSPPRRSPPPARRPAAVGAAFYFKVIRPKQQQAAEPEEDYGEEDLSLIHI